MLPVLLIAVFACVAPSGILRAAGTTPAAPARIASAPEPGLDNVERETLVRWVLAQPEFRARTADHRTRVLRVWSDAAKGDAGTVRRVMVLVRDYDAGVALEITVEMPSRRLEIRELFGVQPSAEEIEEGMAIVRREPGLARFVANPKLRLIGGFHNRSVRPKDPCATEICVEFAFMRPDYAGPARYVIVNLTRGVVAHRDFRARRGGPAAPMTKGVRP